MFDTKSWTIISYCWLALPIAVSTVSADSTDGRLDIYWIDVEGGAATLVVTPAGESVLIDTGYPRHAQRIKNCLNEVAGLNQIDHLIVSHYDGDHCGGAAPLARILPVVNVYDNGRFEGMRRDPGNAYWTLPCKQRTVVQPGDTIPLRHSEATNVRTPKLTCVATRQQFADPSENASRNDQLCKQVRRKETDMSENANSMVLMLEFGPFRFFDATDLTWNLETRLVCPVNLIGEVDVYQVTHHGLDRSNNPLVIRSLKPTVSVMNNGPTKGCHPEVFKNLVGTSSFQAMYQLHKNIRPDGNENNTSDEYIANVKRDSSGNLIKLSVSPDGRSYTTSIPATGHSRTYRTKAVR